MENIAHLSYNKALNEKLDIVLTQIESFGATVLNKEEYNSKGDYLSLEGTFIKIKHNDINAFWEKIRIEDVTGELSSISF